jgi:hypothetical protein
MDRIHLDMPGKDPQQRKGKQWPGQANQQADKMRVHSPADAPAQNNAADFAYADRHQSGHWVHPVTNQDEQNKTTNASGNDAMGEKESEGI